MKRIIATILFTTILFSLSACSANSKQVSEDNTASVGGVLVDSQREQEYSDNLLIISVPAGTPEKDIKDLFSRYSMEIIYEMPNFSMYTVKLSHSMSAEEMDSLIQELEKSDIVLGVSKNYINQLN